MHSSQQAVTGAAMSLEPAALLRILTSYSARMRNSPEAAQHTARPKPWPLWEHEDIQSFM